MKFFRVKEWTFLMFSHDILKNFRNQSFHDILDYFFLKDYFKREILKITVYVMKNHSFIDAY